MGVVANRLKRIRSGLSQQVQVGLDDVAQEAETLAKFISEGHWLTDTGSARASITGYNPEVSNHTKNFNDPDWIAARTGKVISRYGNPPQNYTPLVLQFQKEEDYESYLTMFVEYAADIQSLSDDSGVMALMEATDMMPMVMQRIIGRAIVRGLRS